MLDFVHFIKKQSKSSVTFVPEFVVTKSRDLMVRGGSFYAVWDEEAGLWSTDQFRLCQLVDQELARFAEEYDTELVKDVRWMRYSSTGVWKEFLTYCRNIDNWHELDVDIHFCNEKIKKSEYVSRYLDYALEEGDTNAWDRLVGTLYDESERRKIEWMIGSVIDGDSKYIQKFYVFYGPPGTGKSTVLNIIQDMFGGYYAPFDSRALASANNGFALEMFRTNPRISIQHDGNLSRIEDNTKLNSIVSHEKMLVNEKFKSPYEARFNTTLLMGTNKPVMITDAKSGIIRRLIDISPSERRIPFDEFQGLLKEIESERGAIAYHCLSVYRELGFNYYDKYEPRGMMVQTNDFYNFMEENYHFFANECPDDRVTLTAAWTRYKEYCSESYISYPMKKREFKNELMNYFQRYHLRYDANTRSVFEGFKREMFDYVPETEYVGDAMAKDIRVEIPQWLTMVEQPSIFDSEFGGSTAQYANDEGTPKMPWDKVGSKLWDIDTKKEHFVIPPGNLIVIDFDLKDEDGNKDYQRNIEEARKWPETYAETSKSGGGIHLHYIYNGDVSQLSQIYEEHIEVKKFTGKAALRRKLSICNNSAIATIAVGTLPLKRGEKVLTGETIKSERSLRAMILRNLKKEIHADTTSSINFIHKILEDAYNSGLSYDVTDMRPDIQVFANNSTNKASYCLKMVSKMKFKSEEPSENLEKYDVGNEDIVFFDVEVYPNLFVVVWKKEKDPKLTKWINPGPELIEWLTKFKLVGFNNRLYDNHILYARIMGYTEMELFNLSQRIIGHGRDALFGEAYNMSYTDIYDFLSAQNKMSLKKWEIKLGIHHQEMDIPWTEPVPKELWDKVVEYCTNDVVATEAVWDENQADWKAREILATLSGLTVNDTTNQHTTRIIVGLDKNPQDKYIYTNLAEEFPGYEFNEYGIDKSRYDEGTKIVSGKSLYRGEDPGEGGYVYAEPGIYTNVAVLDIASMHPHSLIALKLFGETYTARFRDIVLARIFIKHKDYDAARKVLDGKLAQHLDDPDDAKELANALKTAINSVYGLTSAKFPNKLRDPRNKDNIVAKRGALFMIDLKHEVQDMGYKVIHIKTDSIKIADADDKIIKFVMDYGEKYGYTFEHEDTYSKICLVNESTYIARYQEPHKDRNTGADIWWTATGAQFQVPYVFKTLFSKEDLKFEDLCETKSVTSAIYLDFNEDIPEGAHDYRFVGKVGLFCPILPGCGGAELLRHAGEGKYSAIAGTKKSGKVQPGESPIYRWMEAEMVKTLGYEKNIDMGYFRDLADKAIDTVNKFGNFEFFASDDIYKDLDWKDVPPWDEDEELPFTDKMNSPVEAA